MFIALGFVDSADRTGGPSHGPTLVGTEQLTPGRTPPTSSVFQPNPRLDTSKGRRLRRLSRAPRLVAKLRPNDPANGRSRESPRTPKRAAHEMPSTAPKALRRSARSDSP